MGRYNNRRTQAAAAALRNTPSRARFSKGPPNKGRVVQKRTNDNDNNNGNNTNRNGSTGTSGSTTRTSTNATSRVIDRLQTRQEQLQQTQAQTQTRLATTEESLQYLDKTKLDYLKLPLDVLENITNLLERLGVKETASTSTIKEKIKEISNDNVETLGDESTVPSTGTSILSAQATPFVMGIGYSEYDDDIQEDDDNEDFDDGYYTGIIPEEPDWEGASESSDEDSISSESTEQDYNDQPAFVHLTQHLSFSESDARSACKAIQNWDAVTDDENPSQKETIALAMDWLCLHLTEQQLIQGFRPNPTPPKKSLISTSSSRVVGPTIRAIPHPSISLATDIVSDKAWARSVRLQERILKLVRLGFHHSEATEACEKTSSKDDAIDAALPKLPALEEPALPLLLSMLQAKIKGEAPNIDSLNRTDLEYAAEERQHEREALEAIYEDQLQVAKDQTTQLDRYSLEIHSAEKGCQLHVFLQLGYPVVDTPLLWFTSPSFSPSLLREINEFMAATAVELLGTPSIFETVNALTDALPELHANFVKVQRKKEFDAEQVRLRKEADNELEPTKDGKLGRRQRAKLKASQKAYDRGLQQQKEEQDRLKRQEDRIQRAQNDSARVRVVHAEQALLKRQHERIHEEAEQAARSAMNAAFNRDESVEQARRAAERARRQCLKEHGMIEDNDDQLSTAHDTTEDGIIGDFDNNKTTSVGVTKETKTTSKTAAFMEQLGRLSNDAPCSLQDESQKDTTEAEQRSDFADTTPTTVAFMERLRQMYDSAAKKKAGYHLAEPRNDKRDKTSLHSPCPVAVPTGELGEVMADVLKLQEEQPWLISPDARVPTIEEPVADDLLSPELNEQQMKISAQLQDDLRRKLRLAAELDDKITSKTTQSGRGVLGTNKYHAMLSIRKRLPAFKMANEIVETIERNQITVIAGDTGCGKTTQVPQLVLDDRILKGQGALTNIIVTQPRRISAIGVSERISQERTEKVGETCGYSIKLEKKVTSKTRLLLCTTGILLRRLQCDPDLAAVSHIFVDEVHERDLNTDFLIIILKDLLKRRKNLKLILMSATLNSEAFSSYFSGCPIVSIPGRAHPVAENRLEDILELTKYQVQEDSDYAFKPSDSKPPKISKSALRKLYYPKYSKETIHSLSIVDETVINYELVVALLENIALNQDEGAILVFMPGMMEITKTIEEMYKKELFQSDKVRIYPLHSSLSTAEQTAIFDVPPKGVRKIVISTNIAETSITIEDVVYVVDTGRVKENRRDEINETPTLVECWVSRASAKQRRGRAGRVRPGIAYHLFSTHTHDNDLTDYQLPEMLRVGIEDLVLQVLILDLGEPASFLGKALNPPSDLAMSNSLKLLEALGAVECKWSLEPRSQNVKHSAESSSDRTCGELRVSSELTALGFHLATLPVDPRVGKLMIYGSLFGCVDPALTIAASMASRSPFISPFDQRDAADEARKNFAVDGSDHLTILNAFDQWKALKDSKKGGNKAINTFLKENFLGRLTLHQMEDLRNQFAKLLKDIGFLPASFQIKSPKGTSANNNAHNIDLVKAVLCAGLYPNILVAPRSLVSATPKKKGDKKVGECAFQSHRKGEVYLHPSTIAFDQDGLDSRYCCYHEIVKTSKIYARDTTTVSPFALLLFGGTLKVHHAHGICSVDDWLKFRLDAKPATLIKYLRGQMERILLRKIVNPQDDVVESAEGKALVESISILFASKDEVLVPQPDRTGGEIVRPWTGSDDTASEDRNHQRGGRGRGPRGGRGRGNGRGRGSRGSGRGSDRGGRT